MRPRGGTRDGAGRTPVEIEPWKLEAAQRHRANGWKWDRIAAQLGVPRRTLKRRLEALAKARPETLGKIKAGGSEDEHVPEEIVEPKPHTEAQEAPPVDRPPAWKHCTFDCLRAKRCEDWRNRRSISAL